MKLLNIYLISVYCSYFTLLSGSVRLLFNCNGNGGGGGGGVKGTAQTDLQDHLVHFKCTVY